MRTFLWFSSLTFLPSSWRCLWVELLTSTLCHSSLIWVDLTRLDPTSSTWWCLQASRADCRIVKSRQFALWSHVCDLVFLFLFGFQGCAVRWPSPCPSGTRPRTPARWCSPPIFLWFSSLFGFVVAAPLRCCPVSGYGKQCQT